MRISVKFFGVKNNFKIRLFQLVWEKQLDINAIAEIGLGFFTSLLTNPKSNFFNISVSDIPSGV